MMQSHLLLFCFFFNTPCGCAVRPPGRHEKTVRGGSEVPYYLELPGKALKVCAGAEFCLILLEDGSLFSFGSNEFGQLGRSLSSEDQLIEGYKPGLVDQSSLGGTRIVDMAAGISHFLVVLENGDCYAAGQNSQGQLGIGSSDTEAHSILEKIPGLSNIKQVAAGDFTSHALDSSGNAFSFGKFDNGSLGIP